MKNIVITQPMGLTDQQLTELRGMGKITYFDNVTKDATEWLERVKKADIVWSNVQGLEVGWHLIKNKYITLPFVSYKFFDIDTLKKNNLLVSNSPGCNQIAVSEWIIGMMLNYSRRLPEFTKTTTFNEPTPIYTKGLHGKSACILGKGAIGSRVGKILNILGLNVSFYTRNDDLKSKISGVDFLIDCLSTNDSTIHFFNKDFFSHTKNGVVFISVSGNQTKVIGDVLSSLSSGQIKHYITDNASASIFDTGDKDYINLLNNPNITITPHVAAYSDNTAVEASKICIQNIRAYLAGSPINLIY